MGQILTTTPWRLRSHRTQTDRPRWPFVINRASSQSLGLTHLFHFQLPHSTDVRGLGGLKPSLTGTSEGGPVWTADPDFGWVLTFDGTNAGGGDDRVNLGSGPTLLTGVGSWWFSAWIFVESTAQENGEYDIYRRSAVSGANGSFVVRVGEFGPSNLTWGVSSNNGSWTDFNAATAITTGRWEHIQAGTDGTTVYFYLNGAADGSAAWTDPSTVADLPHAFGATNAATPAEVLDGSIAEFRMYNRFPGTARDTFARTIYAPNTRWNLYHELGRVFYSVPAAAAVGNPWHVYAQQ